MRGYFSKLAKRCGPVRPMKAGTAAGGRSVAGDFPVASEIVQVQSGAAVARPSAASGIANPAETGNVLVDVSPVPADIPAQPSTADGNNSAARAETESAARPIAVPQDIPQLAGDSKAATHRNQASAEPRPATRARELARPDKPESDSRSRASESRRRAVPIANTATDGEETKLAAEKRQVDTQSQPSKVPDDRETAFAPIRRPGSDAKPESGEHPASETRVASPRPLPDQPRWAGERPAARSNAHKVSVRIGKINVEVRPSVTPAARPAAPRPAAPMQVPDNRLRRHYLREF